MSSAGPQDTEWLGQLLAGFLTAGSVLSLTGDLGAGKTTLTRGLARGLQAAGPVASPTFTLLMEHPAGARGLPLYHFDAYRLDDAQAFLDFDFDAYLEGGGVSVVEWGDRIQAVLPARTLHLALTHAGQGVTAAGLRLIRIHAPADQTLVDRLFGKIRQALEEEGGRP